jgi:Promethin
MATITNTARNVTEGVVDKSHSMIDALFSREKQSEWLEKLKAFAVSRPKLTVSVLMDLNNLKADRQKAFLLINIALSSGPLLLFISFTIAALLFSLIAALLISLVTALLFIVCMLLVALFVVLPTVFLTTMAATFVFLWGLGGFFVISWLNRTGRLGGEVEAVGDKLNNLSGGKLNWWTSESREKPQDRGESKDEKNSSISNPGNGLSGETMSGVAHSANGKAEQPNETAKAAGPDSTAAN